MQSGTCGGRNAEFAEHASELRALYGEPSAIAQRKVLARLDAHCRQFIARSTFVCLSTAAADGSADVSPRGDAPGFVHVLDEQTLLIPDRAGNNRIDSMLNLLENPQLGLLFLAPGVNETLRVNGTGRVVVRSELLETMAVNGKTPRTAIVVTVHEAFLQCAKALIRSKLWTGEYAIERGAFPTLGKMLVDQQVCSMPVTELDALIDTAYREKLY